MVPKQILPLLFALVGCGSSEPMPNDGRDSGISAPDMRDLGLGPDASDRGLDMGGGADIGLDLNGSAREAFGVISGSCGVLDTELTEPSPAWFESIINFGDDPYDDIDLDRLTPGGQKIIADGNAGGSSLLSEVFAYEVLARCEDAVLLKTETEVAYDDPMGKITDLLVEIDGIPIGVSVTRAVGFPRADPYTVAQAETLLVDKLNDVAASSGNVAAEDAWAKQVLHVIAYAPGHAQSLRAAYDSLPASVVSDTIVWVTISEGDDDFLY